MLDLIRVWQRKTVYAEIAETMILAEFAETVIDYTQTHTYTHARAGRHVQEDTHTHTHTE